MRHSRLVWSFGHSLTQLPGSCVKDERQEETASGISPQTWLTFLDSDDQDRTKDIASFGSKMEDSRALRLTDACLLFPSLQPAFVLVTIADVAVHVLPLVLFSSFLSFLITIQRNECTVYACIHIHACVQTCVGIWRPEVSAEHLLSLSTIVFVKGSLAEPGACRTLAAQEALRILLSPFPQHQNFGHTWPCPAFVLVVGLRLGFSGLSDKPSPQHYLSLIFLRIIP